MAELNPQKIGISLSYLLQIPSGVTGELVTVEDGGGNPTCLELSGTSAKINGDLEVTGSVVGQNTFDDLDPESVSATADPGESLSASRSDHVHAHGSQGGGALHAAATTSVAGFMSAGDKSKLDALPTNDALNTTLAGKLATNGDGSAVTVDGMQALGTIFVPAGADITVTVGASGADFTTLAAAWSSVASWIIPDTAWVTISVAAGTYASSSPISLKHPYGHRIRIAGPAVVATTATASGSVTGSAGAWAVPLTVASSAGMAVGDYVLIRPTAGTGQWRLFGGICKISAVTDSTHITVTNTARNAAWPTAALTAATVTALKAALSFTGCDGIQIDGPVGSIDKLALVGDKTVGTIGLIAQRAQQAGKGKAYVHLGASMGITSFGDGGVYAQYGGTVDAASLCVADCLTYNVLAQHGGSVMLNSGIISGGVEAGVAASQNGAVSFEDGIACGNGTHGIYAFGGGAVLAKNGYVWSNVVHGAYAAYGGKIRADNLNAQYSGQDGMFVVDGAAIVVPTGVASNNGIQGVHAQSGGTIYYSSGVANSNGSSGFYADGGTIDCPSATATTNTVNGFTATNAGVVLADGSIATGNTANSYSASKAGYIRATSGTGTVLTVSDGGMIDYTSGTGSPTLTLGIGAGAIITGSGTTYGDMSIAAATVSSLLSSGNIAIGATNSAGFNMDKASNAFVRFAKSGTLRSMFGIDDGGSLVVGAASGDTIVRAEGDFVMAAGGANGRYRLTSSAFKPVTDNAYSLGDGTYRVSVVYAATSTINTSDQREKKDIADCRLGLDFILGLRPVEYRWIVGRNKVDAEVIGQDEDGNDIYREAVTPVPGERVHTGFLAQEVKASLPEGYDWAGWTLDDPADHNSRQGLRTDLLIAPLARAVQELAGRVETLERALAASAGNGGGI